MGNSNYFIYIFLISFVFILILRLFIPFIIYLLPIIIIIYGIRILFSNNRKHETTYTQSTQNQQTYYKDNTSDDIIDVDYKVVDEEDDTH